MQKAADAASFPDGHAATYAEYLERAPGLVEVGTIDTRRLRARVGRLFALRPLENTFPALHGIRVLAIVLVVQYHATVALQSMKLQEASSAVRLSYRVFFGMDLFFVLSGFLVGTIAYRSLMTNKGFVALSRFYARRALRTFAPYYVVLIALALFLPMTAGRQAGLLSEFTFTANYSDGRIHARTMPWAWSLCVEEHFYLAVPLLVVALLRIRNHTVRLWILGVLWMSALFVRFYVFYSYEPGWDAKGSMFRLIYSRTHTRYDTLIAGLLVADVWHHFSDRIGRALESRNLRLFLWSISLAMLVTLCLPMRLLGPVRVVNLFRWGTLTSLMYIPLLLLLLTNRGRVVQLLSHKMFLPIATVGYGIYLVHIPVGWVVMPLVQQLVRNFACPVSIVWALLLAAMCAGAFALAYVLHLVVEKPMLALRDKLFASSCPRADPRFARGRWYLGRHAD